MNDEKCMQCGSLKHSRNECPFYKITSTFQHLTEEDCKKFSLRSTSDHYLHYDVPVYDTHCHIDLVYSRFNHKNISLKDFVTQNHFPTNFKGCITSFSDPPTLLKSDSWSEILSQDGVWASFGVHPHQASEFNDTLEKKLRECLQHSKAIAVGECGLDYSFRNKVPRHQQKSVFCKQISLAKYFHKPLVIHSRQAESDVFEILCEENMQDWPIQIHCFTGTHSQLKKFINVFKNMYFGFTNLVSYSTAVDTHEVARVIPMERVMLETDAPYFIPECLRKTEQFSHPGNVLYVAEEIAKLKKVDVDVVLDQCRINVRTLYKI